MPKIITDDISKYNTEWWEKFYSKYGHHNTEEELETFKLASEIVGDKSIIDVGCGEGEASQYFKDYTGIDWSKTVIDRAKSKYVGLFFNCDIDDIKEHYDYALLSQVMEHLENPSEYIAKIKKVADKVIAIIPNGEIGKTIVDNDKNYLKEMVDVDYHYATYTKEDIDELFNPKWILAEGNNLMFIV